ncbi:MAG: class I SAM-dependent methyltransferase [Planctomycetota bacterium]
MKSRSAFYDGRLYAALVEPFQRRLHERLEQLVEPGSTVLDACCGAGALALRLAGKGARVTGVDLSPAQVGFAETRRRARGIDRATFAVADATDLGRWSAGHFDTAVIVLALHEMPPAERVPTLRELARVSRRVLAVDYAVPLPAGPVGWLSRAIEFAAGPRHFRAFLEFCRRGGLEGIAGKAGLHVGRRETIEGGALVLWELARRSPRVRPVR